ncbi:MAG TPA: hypothetical protein P5121_07315 [Caldilineaceae bacterium]|mgnify:CR=1 FL=1|nr:hypothetical protein [Caldilineaceae bacterium]
MTTQDLTQHETKQQVKAERVHPEYQEGSVARAIEEQTAKLPSDLFLWASFAAMALSLILRIRGSKHQSLFVGQWAAPFLILGLYNKVVKLIGHD